MFQGLKHFLNEHEIDIKDCQGQSYDNASVMSVKFQGLQALVAEENELESWVPYSLNLVRKAAAESCTSAIHFFSFVEEIYRFFTSSRHTRY